MKASLIPLPIVELVATNLRQDNFGEELLFKFSTITPRIAVNASDLALMPMSNAGEIKDTCLRNLLAFS